MAISEGTQSETLKSFKDIIELFSSFKVVDFKHNLSEKFPQASEESVSDILKNMEQLIFLSQNIQLVFENIPAHFLLLNNSIDVTLASYLKMLNAGDIVDFQIYFSSIVNSILVIHKALPSIKAVDFPRISDENAFKALSAYEASADAILLANPDGSKFVEIDKLLSNRQSYVDSKFGAGLGLKANTSFVALAAPSLTGKTQCAFVLRRVKPLYFVMSGFEDPDQQLVYKNFYSLSRILAEFAEIDYKEISKLIGKDKFIGAFELQNHEGIKSLELWTLGFLVKLVDDSKLNFIPSESSSWMNFYSGAKKFDVLKKKISEVTPEHFLDYCLFLDEFVGTNENVFIRNLARSFNMPSVVANTNSKIANLTGKGSSSRFEGIMDIWSIVIPQLDGVILSVFESTYKLRENIDKIVSNGDKAVKCYLEHFYSEQLQDLRPGLASVVCELIKDLAESMESPVTICYLLDLFCNKLFKYLANRKPTMDPRLSVDYFSSLAKIGLFHSISFENETIKDKNGFFRNHEYLKDHLYYLINQSKSDDLLFVTLTPRGAQPHLRYINKLSEAVLWEHELTFFNKKETFTLLACLFFPLKSPVSYLLNAALQKGYVNIQNLADEMNLNAQSLPGNPLEVCSFSSIVDATQHSPHFENNDPSKAQAQKFSLSGSKGTVVLTCILENLILDSSFDKNASGVIVNFQKTKVKKFDLVNFLELSFPLLIRN